MPLTTALADTSRGPTWTSVSMIGSKARLFAVPLALTSTAWPTANTAILVPFSVGAPITFAEIFFQAGTNPGTANFDLGVYRDDFTRITSLGATASVNTTDAILPAGGGSLASPITLPRGRYYVAMSSAATSITVRGNTTTNGATRGYGCISMALAHPLPPTITPAQAVAVLPLIGITTTTNIL